MTDLQRLTIVHETDHGGSYFRFASGSASPKHDKNEDMNKGEKQPKAEHKGTGGKGKTGETKKEQEKAKSGSTSKGQDTSDQGGPAAEGDKTLSDHHGKGDAEVEKKQKEDVGDGPVMTDDEGNSSDHTRVDRLSHDAGR